MFSVNLEQLNDIPAQLNECADIVENAFDRLHEVRMILMQMDTMDETSPRLGRIGSELIEEMQSLSRMSRTLEMAGSYYRRTENRIQSNCSGTRIQTYPARIIPIPGLPQYVTGGEE